MARDYAHRRRAFGKLLIDHPLHLRTLAEQEVLFRGCLQLAFFLVGLQVHSTRSPPFRLLTTNCLQGKIEVGSASKQEGDLMRLLTPIGKLYTARQSTRVILECMECLGGAGYMEDATDLPATLRTQIVCGFLFTYFSFLVRLFSLLSVAVVSLSFFFLCSFLLNCFLTDSSHLR